MADASTRCSILGELWFSYRDNPDYADFISYNDIGMPLAYLLAEGLAEPNAKGMLFVNESWDLFIELMGLGEVEHTLTCLDDVFSMAGTAHFSDLAEEYEEDLEDNPS